MEAGLKLHPQATAYKIGRQTIHQAELLKAGTLDVGSQPFVPEGEVATGEFLLVVWHCAGSGIHLEVCLSFFYPFLCGYFLIHPMCRSHSASLWFSLSGNCSMCSSTFGVSS